MAEDHTERIGGRVSPDAYEGWTQFAHVHRVSITGLLEGIGIWLGALDQPTGRLPTSLRDAVRHGQEVDDRRRRRRGA